jgi:hypothetical protein
MDTQRRHPGRGPVVAASLAGLLALAAAAGGRAGEEAAPRGLGPVRLALVPRDAVGPPAGPTLSYDAELLTTDSLFGLDFHSIAGGGPEAVRVAFASHLERRLLLDAAARLPSSRLVGAQVTRTGGSAARLALPHEDDPARDAAAQVTALVVSGTLVEGERIRLTIRLAEGAPPAARRHAEAAGAGQVTCTIPGGGTVLLNLHRRDAEGRKPERIILLTPRCVARGVELPDARPALN